MTTDGAVVFFWYTAGIPQPIPYEGVHDLNKAEVFADIQQRIISWELPPGSWIVERELVEKYGISRTPIREVLNKLVGLGLLVVQKNRGYQIREFTLKDVIEIFNAREAVEGSCALFACSSTSPDINEKIYELRAELIELDITKDNGSKAIEVGDKVHRLLIQLADNRYLSEFEAKLSSLMVLTRNITKHVRSIEEKSRIDHLNILNALEARDGEKCSSLMREHLNSTCKALAEHYFSTIKNELFIS